MPHLIVRPSGAPGLKSLFVAVYDLFRKGPAIDSVKRLNAS
ncbi:MAG: hypothetical protein ACYTG0_17365 [Planctomycetota bacterium]|jgi:hypothetical protein